MKHLTMTDEQFELLANTVLSDSHLGDLFKVLCDVKLGPEYHGRYVGSDPLFQGESGIVQPIGGGMVKVQIDDGYLWMTHSWITFLAEEWVSL